MSGSTLTYIHLALNSVLPISLLPSPDQIFRQKNKINKNWRIPRKICHGNIHTLSVFHCFKTHQFFNLHSNFSAFFKWQKIAKTVIANWTLKIWSKLCVRGVIWYPRPLITLKLIWVVWPTFRPSGNIGSLNIGQGFRALVAPLFIAFTPYPLYSGLQTEMQ